MIVSLSNTQEARPGRALFLLSLGVALGGCGNSENPPPEVTAGNSISGSATAERSSKPSTADAETAAPRIVNSLTFEASGDVQSQLSSDGADVVLTGGCDEKHQIRMSFTRGQITDKDLFLVRLETAGPVGSGGTGTFPLAKVEWYDGQFVPDGLPDNVNVLVPDAYIGTGNLNLTTHIASLQERRMAGSLEGTVEQLKGENAATVKATFDINLSCAIAP